MENSIQEIISHIKGLIDLNFSILGMSVYSKEVHVDSNHFLKLFNNYKATERNSDEYPIELSEVVDGIKFFAIYSIGELYESDK